MAWWIIWVATLLFTCFRIDAAAAEAPRSAISPAYRIDLKSVMNAEAVPQVGTRETAWVPVVTLAFLSNGRLAATLVAPTREAPGLATRGGPDAASPFRLRGVVIEASTGKVLAAPEWPSNSRAAGIVAVNDRGFVTEIGTELTLFSPELAPIKRLALPPCAANGYVSEGDWYPDSSWSGKHLLLVSGPVWSRACWLWVDAEALRLLAAWEEDRSGPVAVSDDRMVLNPSGRHFGDPPLPLEVAVPGGDWKPLPSTLSSSGQQFVGPDLLYFQRYAAISSPVRPGVFLMRTDTGEVSRLNRLRKGWGFGRAATTRTGKRFAILIGQTKGSHPALDVGGHSVLRGLLIYDAPFRAPSYTLGIRESKIRNGSAALSPDGRHLAVLGYPKLLLEVFDLPPLD
jgi:hypothetical protein